MQRNRRATSRLLLALACVVGSAAGAQELTTPAPCLYCTATTNAVLPAAVASPESAWTLTPGPPSPSRAARITLVSAIALGATTALSVPLLGPAFRGDPVNDFTTRTVMPYVLALTTVMAPLAVYAIGAPFKSGGRLWGTLLGSLGALLVNGLTWLIANAVAPAPHEWSPTSVPAAVLVPGVVLLPVLGAVLGFELSAPRPVPTSAPEFRP